MGQSKFKLSTENDTDRVTVYVEDANGHHATLRVPRITFLSEVARTMGELDKILKKLQPPDA